MTGPTVTQDATRSITGSSTKIYVTATGQGLLSNVLTPLDDPVSGIIDMANTTIELSVWFPSVAQLAGSFLSMYLLSQDGGVIFLNVPQIIPNQWQAMIFNMPTGIQSGRYQLGILYNGSVATTFWVDAVSISERLISWNARANETDPWVPFNDLVNSDTDGVLINRGSGLQIQAQAHRQDAAIMSSPKIVPIYAELGKSLWPEDQQANPNPYTALLATTSGSLAAGTPTTSIPIISFQGTNVLAPYYNAGFRAITLYNGPSQQTVNLTSLPTYGATSLSVSSFTPSTTFAAGSTLMIIGAPWTYSTIGGVRNYQLTTSFTGNFIIANIWTLSDGAVLNGPSVTHAFPSAAPANTSYNVTLTNVDLFGGRSVLTQTIVVP